MKDEGSVCDWEALQNAMVTANLKLHLNLKAIHVRMD